LHWLVTTGAKPCAYAIATHAGKPFGQSLIEALLFIPGVAMVLSPAAAAWALIAGERLRKFTQDFRALNPGLWLLFLVSIGTIVFPAITAAALETDMQPIWALQGLFLFAILIVCGASYPIERFHSVNLAVVVIGMALLAGVVVAPIHAFYRNIHPLHEGRNFYKLAAEELTQQWHLHSDTALPAVGGDDDLAFALAFYSPDHPVYEKRLVNLGTKPLPDPTTFERGWAALCFGEDTYCAAAMERVAVRARRSVRSEFTVRSMLAGQPGASQRFTALLVPPGSKPKPAPPSSSDVAEDFSAIHRNLSSSF
jgi:hypothetical protein